MSLVFMLATIMAIQVSTPPKPSSPSISVFLSATSTELKVGSQIRLKVVVKNTSDHELWIGRSSGKEQGEFLNRFQIHDESGNVPKKTRYYRSITGERLGNDPQDEFNLQTASSVVKPGQSVTEEVILNRVYEVNKAGTYTIQIEHEDPETKQPVKSNEIILTLIT